MDISKIKTLIFSNQPSTDLLVLEMVKNESAHLEELLPELVAVAVSSQFSHIKRSYRESLKPFFTKNQFELFSQDRYGQHHFWNYWGFESYSEKPFLVKIFYTAFKRGIDNGRLASLILEFSDEQFEHREEVFDFFLENLKQPTGQIYEIIFPGLTKEELSSCFNFIDFPDISYVFQNIDLKNIPDDFFQTPRAAIDFRKCRNPEQLVRLNQLCQTHTISISDMEVSLSILEQLNIPKLISLNLRDNNLTIESFDFLKKIPTLKYFSLSGNNRIRSPYLLINEKKIPLTWFPGFEDLEDLASINRPIERVQKSELIRFGHLLGKAPFSELMKRRFLYALILWETKGGLIDLKIWELAALLNLNITRLRTDCLKRIAEKAQVAETHLNENSKVLVLGSFSCKKSEIRSILKTIGASYQTNPDEEFTHLLLGKNPKPFLKLKNKDFQLITENQLHKIIREKHPKFIQKAVSEGEKEVTENIKKLLKSQDPDNISIGIEMLKNGGVPTDFVELLIAIFKTCPQAKIKTGTKKLLMRIVPPDLLPIVNDPHRFMFFHEAKEESIKRKLKKISKKISREAADRLSVIFYKTYQKGLRFALYPFHKNTTGKDDLLNLLIEGKSLQLRKGLGFPVLKNINDVPIKGGVGLYPKNIGLAALKLNPEIEEIDFHCCRIGNLTDDFCKFPTIKKMDLSCNYLNHLPMHFDKFENLEVLDLSENQFNRFPRVLTGVPSLKLLDLRNNRLDDHRVQKIEIPSWAREALPNCKILV